jgi:pimeloyl-ACP methyl ester carboxylesterase
MREAGWLALAAAMLVAATAAPVAVPGTAKYYQVGAAKLYVETSGGGPPILFLHGGMMFYDNSFANQRSYFAADHLLIGIDQRGHGHSPDGPWSLSYKLMADDTAAILEQLGVGPVDVVGHSDGAQVALLLARDHPRLVRRLAISGTNLGSGLTPEQAQARREWPPEKFASKLLQVTGLLPEFIRSDYGRVSPDGPDHWMAMLGKCYLLWIEPVMIETADLKSIEAPVLVIAGEHDSASIEETTAIFRALPHGQLFIVPAAGHLTLIDNPNLVNLAIRQFLDQTSSATPTH